MDFSGISAIYHKGLSAVESRSHTNMESYNAVLIGQGKKMSERLVLLRELAVKQMETLSLVSMDSLKRLPGGDSE